MAYKDSEDYQKALGIVRDFCDGELGGDVSQLVDRRLPGDDPDMSELMQAIYILAWGEIYNLTFDKLGSWGKTPERQYPFRGDTMNSFKSVFGENGAVAEKYKISDELRAKIAEFQKLYHSVGNFIVIPNRGNVNGGRANFDTMRDFFDSFVGAIYQYQHPEEKTPYYEFCEELKWRLEANPEYLEIPFDAWVEKFYLEDYVRDGKPFNAFDIGYDLRKKNRRGDKHDTGNGVWTDAEYADLAQKYYEKASGIIHRRAVKICEKLKQVV